MAHLQKYVPAKEYVTEVNVDGIHNESLHNVYVHPLLFVDDQLTEARARAAKKR